MSAIIYSARKNKLSVHIARSLCALYVALTGFRAQGDERTARIFKLDGAKDVLYTQTTQVNEQSSGEIRWSSVINDVAGNKVMTETAVLLDGKIQSQKVEQLQIKESYDLTVQNKNVIFRSYVITEDGRHELKETKSVDLENNFITGPGTDIFLKRNWSDLMEGKTIKAPFGVFELMKTVMFEFKKTNEDNDSIEVRMRPSNFVFSMFVDPIYISLSKRDKKMIRFKGRTPLREKRGDAWKPLDAEIFYP